MKMIKYFFLLITTIGFSQVSTEEFSIYFETDSAILSEQSILNLEARLVVDKTTKITAISLIGYCDDRGSVSYNQQLATNRVQSVISYLKPRFSDDYFEQKIVGEIPLKDRNNIKAQRYRNRRVEISVTYKKTIEIPKAVVNDSIEKYRSYDILKDSLKIGDKLVFNNVIFYPGRHVLRESSFPVMDSIINSLLLHKKYEIEIQGHICCLSAGVYGRDMDTGQWNLSQARAEQVKRFLVKYGVAADRLTTIGKQANFKTGKGDFYDRRVEIHITGIREDD
ncbi:outer membrane protein [Nonlabens ulvanivorans]|nr:OmpA family protein [Nonlabens ulvanivorans]GAK88870.1 outer membrane protein [Nonlabens ulvanivorans]